MIPQIKKRKIGELVVIDIIGSFTGAWALRAKKQLNTLLFNECSHSIVFNLKQTQTLDTIGLRTIMEAAASLDFALLTADHGIKDLIKHIPDFKQLRIVTSEEDLISLYGKDMVGADTSSEKRRALRFETALPVTLLYEDEDRKELSAVITNISEQGCFIEYIDVKMAEQTLERLNPYDLNILSFSVALPNGKAVKGKGLVVHRRLDDEQFGIGMKFKELSGNSQKILDKYLSDYRLQTIER